MDFEPSDKVRRLEAQVRDFMDREVYPAETVFERQMAEAPDRWQIPPVMEELKAKARAAGLWNLFLPESELGAGLGNLEYAPLCEIMGRSPIAPEVFNCSAPDTGNMETLVRYGTPQQQERWLKPLLAGEIRSAFAMTEPAVASSDATNIEASIRREGNSSYVINARKWWTSGAMDPRCKIFILMGKTDPDAPRHQQQSMILVPRDTPGVTVVRALTVFGYDDAPLDFEGRAHDGHGRQQGCAGRDRDDQGGRAKDAPRRHRPRHPGAWRRRRQPGFRPRLRVGALAHHAHRRRPRRGPQAGGGP